MQPATNEITRRPAPADHFMMTATAAEVSRPAFTTRRLAMDMAFRKPAVLALPVEAPADGAHRPFCVAHESMAGRQISVR